MDQQNERNEIEDLLTAFEPAPAGGSSAEIIYEAGFRAGVKSVPTARSFNGYLAIGSGALSVVLSIALLAVLFRPTNNESTLAPKSPNASPRLVLPTKSQQSTMRKDSTSLAELSAAPDPGSKALAVSSTFSHHSYLKVRTEVLRKGVESLPTNTMRCQPAPTVHELHNVVFPRTPVVAVESDEPLWFDIFNSNRS